MARKFPLTLSKAPRRQGTRVLLETVLSGAVAMSAISCERGNPISAEENKFCESECSKAIDDGKTSEMLKEAHETCVKVCREEISNGTLTVDQKTIVDDAVNNEDTPVLPSETKEKMPEKQGSGISIVAKDVQPGLIAFAEEIKQKEEDSKIWIGRLEGNGGREVIIYMPAGSDPAKPYKRILHFHGTYGEQIGKRKVALNRFQQTIDAMKALQEEGVFNPVLIYPLTAGRRAEPERRRWFQNYDRMCMKTVEGDHRYQDNPDQLIAEATEIAEEQLRIARENWSTEITAEGHSSGGICSKNAAQFGSQKITEYLFLDASYDGWEMDTYSAIQTFNPKAKMTLVNLLGLGKDRDHPYNWCENFEEDAAFWEASKDWCETNDENAKPPFVKDLPNVTDDAPEAEEEEENEEGKSMQAIKKSCKTLKERAELWSKGGYSKWCTETRKRAKNLTIIEIPRTGPHVPEGERIMLHKYFPGQFSGGLNLSKFPPKVFPKEIEKEGD